MHFLRIQQKSTTFRYHPAFVPLILLLLSILAYGLLIPWLHLYLDDWLWTWTWQKMGPAGLIKYFSTNRPVWGLLYQIVIPLLYPHVIAYHLYGLVVRWASALVFYWLLVLLWPSRRQNALYGSVIFLLYPGFVMQPVGLTYGSLFVVYIFFLLSLCLNILALKKPHRYWLYTIPALLLSAANLFMVEFYFTLELTRFFILWLMVRRSENNTLQQLKKGLTAWRPYLLIFGTAAIWRAFFFKFQNFRYQFSFSQQFKIHPFNAVVTLLKTMAVDLWQVTLGAWVTAISRLAHLNYRLPTSLVTWILLFLTAGLIWWILFSRRSSAQTWQTPWAWESMILGLLSMLTAGWPFWLTGLSIGTVSYSSRFTLPFMVGATLFLLGLLASIRLEWLRSGIVALALGIAVANHFQVANDFRLSWEADQKVFWQFAWRVPALKQGTAVLFPEASIPYYNLPVFATELATMYPTSGNDLPYYVFYLDQLYWDTNGLPDGLSLSDNNVTSEFHGSTSQLLVGLFNKSECLRFLDRTVDDIDEAQIPRVMKAASLSDLSLIQVNQPEKQPDTGLFGQEPKHDWCYYYEKADLARQQRDWQKVLRLGEDAKRLGYAPLKWDENLLFIEAKAHLGKWDEAIKDTQAYYDDNSKGPITCRIWTRMIATTDPSADKDRAVQSLIQSHICPSFKH